MMYVCERRNRGAPHDDDDMRWRVLSHLVLPVDALLDHPGGLAVQPLAGVLPSRHGRRRPTNSPAGHQSSLALLPEYVDVLLLSLENLLGPLMYWHVILA